MLPQLLILEHFPSKSGSTLEDRPAQSIFCTPFRMIVEFIFEIPSDEGKHHLVEQQPDEYEKLGSYAMIGLPDVYETRYGEFSLDSRAVQCSAVQYGTQSPARRACLQV